MKKILGLFMFLMIAGGGLLTVYKLMGQNQDKRSSASYAGAVFSVLPSTNNVTVGDSLVTQLVLNVGTGKTLNSVDIRIKYDKTKLSINAAGIIPLLRGGLGDVTPSNRLFTDNDGVLFKVIDANAGTIRLSGVNLSSTNLPTGVVYLFKLVFTAIAEGTGVRVEMDPAYNNMALAEVTGVADKAYSFDTKEAGVYSITASNTPSCQVVNCTNTVPANASRACVNNECGFTCNMGYSLENGACVQAVGPVIKLKVKLPKSEVPGGVSCPSASDIRLTVTALGKNSAGDSVERAYENILLTAEGTIANNYQVYNGQFVLTSFAPRSGVSFLVRGPKHLQVKYGKNNQNNFFQGNGELTITEGENNFDFTGYPLMPGDVSTATGWGQDLVVGGYDFARVKEQVLKGMTGNLAADLDYNCVLNSLDLNLLKQSLNEKLGQTN